MLNLTPIITAAASFVACTVLGIFVIPFLRRLKFGQTILEDGPKWHKSKQGTPTMGGIMIIAAVIVGLVVALIWSLAADNRLIYELRYRYYLVNLLGGLIFALMCGIIGLMDDYIKVVKKRNLGLTAKQKTVLQLFVSASYLGVLAISGMDTTWIPFVGDVSITSGFGIIFWPISLIFIYYLVNAVNLTDGIDGLASSVTLVVACAFMLMAGRSANTSLTCFSAAVGGGCLGFLIYNSKPAKVFMGDTGSMFLGGAVVALGYGSGRPILLLLIGIVYILEALSVVLQVFFFKTTGKRIFKMSPIHHHFEMSGWSEEKICFVFGAVAMLASVLALLSVFLGW